MKFIHFVRWKAGYNDDSSVPNRGALGLSYLNSYCISASFPFFPAFCDFQFYNTVDSTERMRIVFVGNLGSNL